MSLTRLHLPAELESRITKLQLAIPDCGLDLADFALKIAVIGLRPVRPDLVAVAHPTQKQMLFLINFGIRILESMDPAERITMYADFQKEEISKDPVMLTIPNGRN